MKSDAEAEESQSGPVLQLTPGLVYRTLEAAAAGPAAAEHAAAWQWLLRGFKDAYMAR